MRQFKWYNHNYVLTQLVSENIVVIIQISWIFCGNYVQYRECRVNIQKKINKIKTKLDFILMERPKQFRDVNIVERMTPKTITKSVNPQSRKRKTEIKRRKRKRDENIYDLML